MVSKGFKGWWSHILMPEWCTFHNTIFDIKCSKCKKTQENHYFVQRGKVYKTCNECRGRDQTRRGIQFRNNLSPMFSAHLARYNDSDDESAVNDVLLPSSSAANPVDSLIALGFNYNDMQAALSMSSSSAAAAVSSSSADYFVDEPDPEPEPEGS